MRRQYVAIIGSMFFGIVGFCQTPEQEEFIKLYKENYIEWISSPEIARLQDRDPELKYLIEEISITETNAYKMALEKARAERKDGEPKGITDLLGDGAMEVSMDIIKELVSKKNTDVIINLYWDVIQSAESQEIVDLIMPHVKKLRNDFETAGIDVANTVKH